MVVEKKKLLGFRKSVTKAGKEFATLYFGETRPDVVGEYTTSVNVFVSSLIPLLDKSLVGKDIELQFNVDYSRNAIFLINVKPV